VAPEADMKKSMNGGNIRTGVYSDAPQRSGSIKQIFANDFTKYDPKQDDDNFPKQNGKASKFAPERNYDDTPAPLQKPQIDIDDLEVSDDDNGTD